MKIAEERYEETWNSYLELLNKDPRASLVSFTKLKSVYYRGMTKWMSRKGLSVFDAKAKIRDCHRKALSVEPIPQFGLSSHAFRDIAFRVIGHSSYPKASDLL